MSSPAVEFSKEKKVQLSREVNDVLFLGMPNDNCKPGQQEVLITITDAEYGFEYNAFPVQVQVVDYQFDHVSRPMFQRAVSLISATSAVIMWALSFLEQIDKSWGLPAGAAAAAVAAFFVYQLTQLTKTTTTNIP